MGVSFADLGEIVDMEDSCVFLLMTRNPLLLPSFDGSIEL